MHNYEGLKLASEFLIERGVPRTARKEVLESFVLGIIKFELAGSTTSGIRFWGGGAKVDGIFWLTSFSPLTNRANMALPIHWNTMSNIVSRRVAAGTTIIRGIAAEQMKYGDIFVGGAEQLLVLDSRVPGLLF